MTESAPQRKTPRKRITPRGPTNVVQSEAQKKLWADPAHKARMQAKLNGPEAIAKRKRGRGGIPDGYTREQARHMWRAARESAEATVKAMIEKEVVQLPADTSDAARAEEAMVTTLTLMRADIAVEHKLRAARQVLEWTKAKPESKSKVTVQSAEDFLAAALSDDE